ncbi:MAG: recombinase family protein [Anaerostipes sp.]|nr:recombinase family protein [Anaerostipes sp.]
MRCVSYTKRYSCFPENEIPEDIILQQNKRINEFVVSHGWKLVKKYYERKDGQEAEDAFLRMKASGLAREFECVVVDSIFRCGKNPAYAEDLFRKVFWPAGIHFAVVEDNISSINMTSDEVTEYLVRKREEYYDFFRQSQITKFNEKRVYERYGYHSTMNGNIQQMEIDMQVKNIIEDIFNMADAGNSISAIVRTLNERGIESRTAYLKRNHMLKRKNTNDRWTSSGVRAVLVNRMYIGEWERTVNGKKVAIHCPAIIERTQFDRVQQGLTARAPVASKTHVPGKANPFAKKIVDRDTGYPLMIYTHPKSKERIFRFKYPKPAEIFYEKPFIKYETVVQEVKNAIKGEKSKAEWALTMLGTEEGKIQKDMQVGSFRKQAKKITDRMSEVCNENIQIYQKYENNEMSELDFLDEQKKNNLLFEKYDRKLQEIIESIKVEQKTFSNENLWIVKYANVVVEDTISSAKVTEWIDGVDVVGFESVEVHFKEQDWFQRLPAEWFVNLGMGEDTWHEKAEE